MEQAPSKAQQTAREALDKAQQAAHGLKEQGQQAAQSLKEQGKHKLESGKEGAAETVDHLADAVSRASTELHDQQQHGLADYASQLASGIGQFADTLRNRSIDDLIDETESLARRNPTVFFLGSIGVGLALSRFLKASPAGAQDQTLDEMRTEAGDIDVSYDTGAEWQAPETSQSIQSPLSSPGSPNNPSGGAYR